MTQLPSDASSTQAVIVLKTGQRLDEANVEPLMNGVHQSIRDGVEVIIFNCSDLEYITSMGLAALLRTRKLLRDHHGEHKPNSHSNDDNGNIARVRLVNVSSHVQEVLKTAQLLKVLPSFEDVQSATPSNFLG